MALCGCYCRRDCTLAAIVVSVVLGIVTAFLQISGVITVVPAFLWVALGIAVVYLAVLVAATVLMNRSDKTCLCPALSTVLVGILGTVLFSLVLLAVGIVATSILSAVLVGLLLAFLFLILTASACLVRCLADCGN